MKKCTLYCENTDFAKNAQFRLLILPFFTLKMRISKNRSIFLFPHLPTTHKPKIVMTHQEMRPVVRKKTEKLRDGGTEGTAHSNTPSAFSRGVTRRVLAFLSVFYCFITTNKEN